MAHDLGMSVGAMQSAFKSAYGRTIADYSRELQLERARGGGAAGEAQRVDSVISAWALNTSNRSAIERSRLVSTLTVAVMPARSGGASA